MELETRIEKWQRLWKLLQDLRKRDDYPSQKEVNLDLDECIALATELRIAEEKGEAGEDDETEPETDTEDAEKAEGVENE